MFDPVLLRAFLAVAEEQGFSRAAQRLGVQQSTVSQQIRRLEEQAGRQLFLRDTRSVRLSADGEAMLAFARDILNLNERARRHFSGSELRGRIRLGVSEDFAITRMPKVLRDFRNVHPAVEIELTLSLSVPLHAALAAGKLDLVLAKRRLGEETGLLVRRERMVWLGANDLVPGAEDVLPLVLYPAPSIGRTVALEALAKAGMNWRIACTSTSFSGLHAAVLAGLGVTVQVESVTPAGLRILGARHGLPELPDVEFVLTGHRPAHGPVAELVAAIMDSLGR